MTHSYKSFLIAVLVLLTYGTPNHGQTVFMDSGPDAASIQDTVNAFRDGLGLLNPFEPANFAGGRRQINWDAAPDAVSAPNSFPGDFFNFSASPRARGIEFTTPGSGFQLSATAASGEGIEFDNINNTYSNLFSTFSAERLFTPIGSNVTEVKFFDPANQTTPALVRGFGAVFSDVDITGASFLEFFDANGEQLQKVNVFLGGDNEDLSFGGLLFDEPVIGSVQITTGTAALGGDVFEIPSAGIDLVVLDDFIFGEPAPIPEPASARLLGLGILGWFSRCRFSGREPRLLSAWL